MVTDPAIAPLIAAMIHGHAGELWTGYRFSDADARAFTVDQETAGGNYLAVESRGGGGESLWYVIGESRPTLVRGDRARLPKFAAMPLRAMLDRPRTVLLSEFWTDVLRRAAA
jgi:hypothetical protein